MSQIALSFCFPNQEPHNEVGVSWQQVQLASSDQSVEHNVDEWLPADRVATPCAVGLVTSQLSKLAPCETDSFHGNEHRVPYCQTKSVYH